jgi:hypothetical protein
MKNTRRLTGSIVKHYFKKRLAMAENDASWIHTIPGFMVPIALLFA